MVDNEKGAHQEPIAVENFQYTQGYEISVIIVSNGQLGDWGKGKKPQCVHLDFCFQWEHCLAANCRSKIPLSYLLA